MTKADEGDKPAMNDEAAMALQKQIAELGERLDQLAAKAGGGVPSQRLARLERLASVFGAVICEMHTSTVKSDITALQKEIVELLTPIRAGFDAVEEAAHVA